MSTDNNRSYLHRLESITYLVILHNAHSGTQFSHANRSGMNSIPGRIKNSFSRGRGRGQILAG
jgi:hypothetical protein